MSEPNIPHQIARAIRARARAIHAEAVRINRFPIPEAEAHIDGMAEAAEIARTFRAAGVPDDAGEPAGDLEWAEDVIRGALAGMPESDRVDLWNRLANGYCRICGDRDTLFCYCMRAE